MARAAFKREAFQRGSRWSSVSDTTGIIDARIPHPGGVAAMTSTHLKGITASAAPERNWNSCGNARA